MRETALLTAPVVVMGALGWWASRRPVLPLDDGKLHPQFRLEAPSALEAFRGANAAFVIEIPGAAAKNISFHNNPYLQLKTPHGVETAWQYRGSNLSWRFKLWNYSAHHNDTSRFLLRTSEVPDGEMHFGFFGIGQSYGAVAASPAMSAPPKPVRLSGKWKVDRAQLKPLNLVTWPRQPLVRLREARVTEVYLSPNIKLNGPNSVTAECIFVLQGATTDAKTSFEASFSEHHFVPRNRSTYGASWGLGQIVKETPRIRVRQWSVNDDSTATQLNVSGRVSADGRWPLGFQIAPFNFKTVKVGQKLKFKQFPVPLPK